MTASAGSKPYPGRSSVSRLAALAVVSALALGACSSYPRTYSNVSPAADFGKYSTFAFAAELGTDEGRDYRSLLSQYLIAEIRDQMSARGYSYLADGADIEFNFDVVEQEKIRSTGGTTFGGYYGYGYPRWPYYYGGYGTGPTIRQYTEGSLNVVIIDTGTREVIWEGVSITRLTDERRDNLDATVQEAVAELFNRFPYYAPGFSRPALADTATDRSGG